MNLINEPSIQNLMQEDMEEWVIDLKRVYDIYHKMLKK